MAIGRPSRPGRATASLLVFALIFSPGLVRPAVAQEGKGAIRGVLYLADGKTPLAGARAHAVQVNTAEHYTSAVTAENGAYEIAGLPSGTYDLAIEVGGAVFVAEGLVDLLPNQSVTISYSVQPEKPAARPVHGLEPPQGSAVPLADLKPAGTGQFWKSPSGQALLWVLGAGAAIAIYNNLDHAPAGSPSTP
jgi:hypothetical protein